MKIKKTIKSFLNVIIMLLIMLFVTVSINSVNAYDSIDPTGVTSFDVSNEIKTDKYGVNYSYMTGFPTTNGGKGIEKKVNYFSMKTDGENSKLVTWVRQRGNSQINTTTLTSLATDYEKNHPGWIVVAGINADQWYYGTTTHDPKGGYFYYKNQTYYPLTVDGENLFTVNPLGASVNGVGITNNFEKPLIDTNGISGVELQIYDANNSLIGTYPVSGYNTLSSSGNTTVWSGYYSAEVSEQFVERNVNSSNNLYIVENANLAYMNNTKDYANHTHGIYAAIDSFYGNGCISKIEKEVILGAGQFAIDTTNEEIIEKLTIGTKVVVEQQYKEDGANDVESVTGYHTMHYKDGVCMNSSAPYNTQTRPRSLFGINDNGEYFLMTTRNVLTSGTGGTTYSETNAILEYYGVKTAYQDDGGGSVTAIYRNDNGGFDVTSESVDAAEQRSICTGLFFVVRDPGYKSNLKESTPTSISVTKDDTTFAKEITNAVAIIDEKEYPLNEEITVIENLKENTTYEVKIKYEHNGKNYEGLLYATTKEYNDGLDFSPKTYGFIVKRRTTDDVLKTTKVIFDIAGKTYEMQDVDSFEITGLQKNKEYEIKYTYTVLNTITNETYTKEGTTKTISTLSYDIPKIVKFEEIRKTDTKLNIKYEYSDYDQIVTKAYIMVNDTEYELTEKSGVLRLEDLNFETTSYKVQFFIEYEDPKQRPYKLESEILMYEKEHVHSWDEATCENPKTCKTCGETQGEALGHNMQQATCENPSKCSRCEYTQGEALGHSWQDATEEKPKTCSVCGKTEGEKLPSVKTEEPKKKGCKKSSLANILISISLLAGSVMIIRKRK